MAEIKEEKDPTPLGIGNFQQGHWQAATTTNFLKSW